MPRRRSSLLIAASLGSSLGLLACSGASQRDVNFGTEAGADYGLHLPDLRFETATESDAPDAAAPSDASDATSSDASDASDDASDGETS